MGYANYWWRPAELPREIFTAAASDVRQLLRRFKHEVAGPPGTGEPTITEDLIAFNGAMPDMAQSFRICRIEDPNDPFPRGFCKTRLLPYDLAVKATLLLLRHHAGESFKFSSDDVDERLWLKAAGYCQEIPGFPKCPTWLEKLLRMPSARA